ncbi:site-specific recombinase XerD [Chryseobacterium sp. H1D6B]|uniref:phage integrase SAM-like domain-containing protein n=1 Tax=Chryseobacterium sp. H1D6B TaxID=2940588 RepID=UPI001808837A|nr:site-specific integrase [Chryseobacterium sp. H1D6B]MDH6250365.1 site-specific recombinase XerD [Chryseobacterium sp. H1D6B]
MALAESILAIKKAEYVQGRYDLKDTVKSKRTFLTYFEELTDEKRLQDSSNNYGNWFSTLQHLKKIVSKNMTFEEIDERFVKKVHRYFEKEALTKSEIPLSQNSKYSYFNKFKAALRNAFGNGYLTINYASKIKSFEQAESQREYLIFDELQRLAKAECKLLFYFLENGADIYTVSKRLGHRELRTTQIYAKIVDSKMKEAAEIIPELNIEL